MGKRVSLAALVIVVGSGLMLFAWSCYRRTVPADLPSPALEATRALRSVAPPSATQTRPASATMTLTSTPRPTYPTRTPWHPSQRPSATLTTAPGPGGPDEEVRAATREALTRAAQTREARARRLTMMAASVGTPTPTPSRVWPSMAPSRVPTPRPQTGCVCAPGVKCIKGNVSYSTGERIYHCPGCPYYEETVINPAYGERWFSSEAEARAAGWRKARNCP